MVNFHYFLAQFKTFHYLCGRNLRAYNKGNKLIYKSYEKVFLLCHLCNDSIAHGL